MRLRRRARLCLVLLLFCAASACRGGAGQENEADAHGIIVVNAPATGVVRRVLVSEGATVNAGASIVEIAVPQQAPQASAAPTADPVTRAAQSIQTAQGEIDAARAEVVRAEVEVRRLEPLVAAGQAAQGELDGARARYDLAQQRFQRAQSAAQGAQSGLTAARQQEHGVTAGVTAAPAEQLVAARASSAGTVSVVSIREGQRVTAGQPLATLRVGGR